MSDTSKVAANLQAFRMAVNAHDRNNPEPHPAAYGIGLAWHDLTRLGFDDGEVLWEGITIHGIESVSTGNFKVMCGGEHDDTPEAVTTDARDHVHA